MDNHTKKCDCGGWMDIETAPSYADALVIGGEESFPIAAWKNNCGVWERLEEGGGFIYASSRLTHWMPLPPEPPEKQS